MLTICFTGHRPNKLGGYDWNSSKNLKIRNKISETVKDIINSTKEEDIHFITGGAIGVDQFAFEEVYKIKSEVNKKITMEIAIPFKRQASKWFDEKDITRYYQQLYLSDKMTFVDEMEGYVKCSTPYGEYNPIKMEYRNRYMVDNSDIIIAVWNGDKKGGTWNCIKYAQKLKKNIIYVNPNEI